MRTLYLRNVPDEVGDGLTVLAARAGMSVSAFAVRELAAAAQRARAPELLADLPDLGVPVDAVVAGVQAARAER